MAWSTPRAWASGELVTAGNMNTYISADLSYLKGSAGAVAIDSAVSVTGAISATGALSGTNGTFSGTIATAAINSTDWFRVSTAGFGLFNSSTSHGIGLPAGGPQLYSSSDYIVGRTATETMSNKTLVDPKWSGVTGFLTTGNDLTNYMMVQGTGTFTLPSASGRTGQIRFIKAIGGAVTVNSGSANLVGPGGTTGVSSFALGNGDSVTMVCDGTNWWTV